MTQQQQEEVNLLKELIADSSISADERMIYEDALSELMKSEKPKASNELKPKGTTERKPRTTTQRNPQVPKQSKSDIELAKAEIKRRTGKTEEECESIVNEYRSLRAKSVERKKKETIASAENKDRVAKLKKDDKIISGTSEKTADAVIETTTKDVAKKIVKEIDKIEQKAEVEATKEVKKEMPKESTTQQNKAIAEKTEEKVKAQTKTIVKRIVIDTSSLLSSIAESLGKFDKDSQKEFLIKLRSDIDKLLTKYSYGGSTMGATQGFNITQSNMSSSSVNSFGNGGSIRSKKRGEKITILGNTYEFLRIEMDNSKGYEEERVVLYDLSDKSMKSMPLDMVEAYSKYSKGGGVNKFVGGGGVDNPSKKEMLDYLNMYFDNYSELRTIAIEEDNILTRKMLNSLDDEELEMAYDDAKYEIKADTQFKRGGGVRIGSDGREYPFGSAWALEHNSNNKSEDYEIPLNKRKFVGGGGVGYKKGDMVFIPSTNQKGEVVNYGSNWVTILLAHSKERKVFDFNEIEKFTNGGGVENGYMVFNYSDDYYATDNVFATKKEANNFIKEFRNRYKQQGYFRDNRMNKIAIEDIDLEIIPSDFNPFGKFNGGGGVNSGLNYGKKDDVFIEVITLLNSKLEKPTFMGKQTNTKQVMSVDSFIDYIKKYEMDERYEVNVPIELFTKESFNQYSSDNSKLKLITGSISLLGKEDLLKKYIRNKESLLSNRLTYNQIEKINDRTSIKNAPEKTTIVKRIASKQLLENGGGVEEKEDYFFDEDDYENN